MGRALMVFSAKSLTLPELLDEGRFLWMCVLSP
jgi:hypothetical protein